MDSTRQMPITLAGRALGKERHVCAFFNSEEEEFDTLLPFVQEGMARGEKALHIVNPTNRETYLRRLDEGGVAVGKKELPCQFEVRIWDETYLKPGHFDQTAMLNLVQEILRSGKREGFPLTRAVAHMEWCLSESAGVEDIVEYESRLNYFLPQFDDVVICTYDIAKHTAEVIMGALRTHPVAIIGGIMQVNPFYIEPDDYLAELRAQRARSRAV